MRPNVYIAGDYAGFETSKYNAYYGWEKTDPDTGEWLFTLSRKTITGEKEVFRATNSQLLEYCGNESPEGMLLAGIAMWMGR